MLAFCLLVLGFAPIRPGLLPQNIASASDSDLMREADARIARIRMGDAALVVLGGNGKPLRNAKVMVEQTRHAFLFGCAALSLLNHADAAQESLYQKQFGDLFNFATLLTYWQDTAPAPERQNLDKLTAQTAKLRQMGIQVKGHPLVLAGAIPRWVSSDPDQVRELTRKRIGDMVSHFKGQITVWDVVGDATTASGVQNGLGAWARKAGAAQFTSEALTWARTANPDALLLYNDYKLDADYTNLVRDIAKAGAPLDVLGLEAHMIGSEWPLSQVWDRAQLFGSLGKPLHFSEITVLSDDPKADHSKAWPSTPEGEQRQADYVEKLYTLLFSHPAVRAIGWWNFVDGDWDRNPGGLLRADLSRKPAYERLHILIKTKWWTRIETRTDGKGVLRFRGFAGHYRLTTQTPQATLTAETDIRPTEKNTPTLPMQPQTTKP